MEGNLPELHDNGVDEGTKLAEMLLESFVSCGVVESTNEHFPSGLGKTALAIPKRGQEWSLTHFYLSPIFVESWV